MKIKASEIPEDIKPFSILDYKKINMKSVEVKLEPSIKMIYRLCKTCKENDGIGLAAPQVGIFDRIFVVFDSKEDCFDVFVNPTWKAKTEAGKSSEEEGCLSVTGLQFFVNRWNSIEAAWEEWSTDESGKKHKTVRKQVLDGLRARVFQHEHQHLSGICIVDVGVRGR
jgi:peptide deformylase